MKPNKHRPMGYSRCQVQQLHKQINKNSNRAICYWIINNSKMWWLEITLLLIYSWFFDLDRAWWKQLVCAPQSVSWVGPTRAAGPPSKLAYSHGGVLVLLLAGSSAGVGDAGSWFLVDAASWAYQFSHMWPFHVVATLVLLELSDFLHSAGFPQSKKKTEAFMAA